MHRALSPLVPLIAVAVLTFPACSDLAPGEPGIFSNDGAVAGGRLAQAGNTRSAERKATGFSSGAMVTATVNIITKHQATERQRRIAVERARAALTRIQAGQKRATTSATKPRKKVVKAPDERAAIKTQKVDARPEPSKKTLPRYIAVDTVKDARTSPRAEKAVMIFDTQTQEIVGNNVYDVRSTPAIGGTARFETFTAEYVGTGS